MKQIIFLCLLSLTMCYSKPAESQGPTLQDSGKPVSTSIKPTETTPATQIPTHAEPNSSPKNTNSEKPLVSTNAINTQTSPETLTTVKETINPPVTNDSKITPKKGNEAVPTNSHELKPKNETSNASDPNNAASNEKPGENKDTNKGIPAQPPAKPSDTPKVTPKADDDKHIVEARGFDGPSFMGGIILTLGLLAIGFMGFKYYKNQTERNYHTL